MKEVIQGDTITLDVRIYDKDPSLGGIPTDPDSYLHTWDIVNDIGGYVSAVSLYYGSLWPTAPTYYFSIVDSGTDFEVIVYSDSARTVEIATTGTLAYGVFVNQAINEYGASTYTGAINVTFGGTGSENFEITDIGPTSPVYQIRSEDNTLVMPDTLYPTRLAVGHYQTTYAISITATLGENWRIISRGLVNNIDIYYTEFFRVIDASVATDEAAKLVTLSEVKAELKIFDNNSDSWIEGLILPASILCEEYLDIKFHTADNVAILDGNGASRLYFDDEGPIFSISLLEYRTGTSWDAYVSTDYTYGERFIDLINGQSFDSGNANIRVTYQYGVARIPAPIKKGICELIRYWKATENRTGLKRDNVGLGISSEFLDLAGELPAAVRQLWDQYARMR
jgi:hypothetical protein